MQKKLHFALRYIINNYRRVLIPNYKRKYDQSDQIEKYIQALYLGIVLFLQETNGF